MENNVITVYAESTPNPASLKFVTNRLLLQGTVEYLKREQAVNSPFAQQLFDFSCVTGIFITNNFVTITKTADTDWHDVMNIIREFIKSYLTSEDPIFTDTAEPKPIERVELSNEENHHIEEQIKQILDEYIRPAVEMDGGAIHLKSFHDGVVTVKLKGSCSGCPSSTVTLKSGIERLLKNMVPEVAEVVAE